MTPCATTENCRDTQYQYLCIFMSVPASCSDSDSFLLPKAGKNPSTWILSHVWVMIMWIACLLAKDFVLCQQWSPKKPSSIWKHDKMALPQNFIPLWQILFWDMSQGVSADCCLSEAEWCHHQHSLDENQVAVARFINSSAAVQLMNRCDVGTEMMTRLWSNLESL